MSELDENVVEPARASIEQQAGPAIETNLNVVAESAEEPAVKKARLSSLSSAPKFSHEEYRLKGAPPTKACAPIGQLGGAQRQAAGSRSTPRHQHRLHEMQQQQGMQAMPIKQAGSVLTVSEVSPTTNSPDPMCRYLGARIYLVREDVNLRFDAGSHRSSRTGCR
jgi:hypothetical protein